MSEIDRLLAGPAARPHEDVDLHWRHGHVALIRTPGPKLWIGGFRKPVGSPRGDMMPLAEVTDCGEEGALDRARFFAWLVGKDRLEILDVDGLGAVSRAVTIGFGPGRPTDPPPRKRPT